MYSVPQSQPVFEKIIYIYFSVLYISMGWIPHWGFTRFLTTSFSPYDSLMFFFRTFTKDETQISSTVINAIFLFFKFFLRTLTEGFLCRRRISRYWCWKTLHFSFDNMATHFLSFCEVACNICSLVKLLLCTNMLRDFACRHFLVFFRAFILLPSFFFQWQQIWRHVIAN